MTQCRHHDHAGRRCRIDGLGSVAPLTARLFNPATHPEGAVNFLFDPSVFAGNPALTVALVERFLGSERARCGI